MAAHLPRQPPAHLLVWLSLAPPAEHHLGRLLLDVLHRSAGMEQLGKATDLGEAGQRLHGGASADVGQPWQCQELTHPCRTPPRNAVRTTSPRFRSSAARAASSRLDIFAPAQPSRAAWTKAVKKQSCTPCQELVEHNQLGGNRRRGNRQQQPTATRMHPKLLACGQPACSRMQSGQGPGCKIGHYERSCAITLQQDACQLHKGAGHDNPQKMCRGTPSTGEAKIACTGAAMLTRHVRSAGSAR